mgnify:CR=1 FL=1
MSAEFLGRGGAWLDAGSIKDYYETSAFVSALENRQGFKIACLEEIAFNNDWISSETVLKQHHKYKNSPYGEYLIQLIK